MEGVGLTGHQHHREERIYFAQEPGHSHEHDGDASHPIEDNPIWQQDNVFLSSVGIDVGSSGTQVIFSRLHLRRIGEDLSSRYIVIRRQQVYQSPVALTPYADVHHIAADRLGAIIDQAYAAARLNPEDVDTGVVILTGEALRRRNAERITELLAERAGDLVCASAGHNMEARLAAYGSGAAKRSHVDGSRILNIDIGGGTTKLALVDRGEVRETAAVHIGGRLQVVDEQGHITRLELAGRQHARRAGFDWRLGQQIDRNDLAVVGDAMAQVLGRAIFDADRSSDLDSLYLTDKLPPLGHLDGILVSGGVAEYVYDREHRDFGDLGIHLGRAFMRVLRDRGLNVLDAGQCIRATALGASEYSVQLSGNTGWIPNPGAMLPRRSLQVIQPGYELSDTIDPVLISESIGSELHAFDRDGDHGEIAVALHWTGLPSYERLRAFAEGVATGLSVGIAVGRPLYLVLDGDVAMSLGRILSEELGLGDRIVVLDGVRLSEFDYVDLGQLRYPSNTVPVTVKSLVFSEASGVSATVSMNPTN